MTRTRMRLDGFTPEQKRARKTAQAHASLVRLTAEREAERLQREAALLEARNTQLQQFATWLPPNTYARDGQTKACDTSEVLGRRQRSHNACTGVPFDLSDDIVYTTGLGWLRKQDRDDIVSIVVGLVGIPDVPVADEPVLSEPTPERR